MLAEGAGGRDRARDRRRHRLPRREPHEQRAASTRPRSGCTCRSRGSREALPIMADVALRPTFPHGRARAAAPAAARQPAPGTRRPGDDCLAGVLARALRRDAPLRHGDDGHGGRRSRRSRRTICGRSTTARTGPRTRRSSSSATSRPTRPCRCSRRASGLEGDRARRRRGSRSPTPTPPRRAHGLSRRQAGRAAVADPHRTDRRAALDARLLPDSGDEHDSRRLVHLAPEPEPAREARLHLRRGVGLRHAGRGRARSSPRPACRPTRPSESLTEFFNELNGILQPVPADELARAKNYVALRFPSGFETTGDISRRLEDVLVYHLPRRLLLEVRPEHPGRHRRRRPARRPRATSSPTFAVVVVGDRKTIEPGINALNLGPITIMSVDEIF